VEGGAKVVAPVVVQGPAVVSNDKPVAASGPKEPDNGLSLNVVPAPSPVAVGKGNVESSTSSSDDDSSDSGSEESDSGSDSSSTTSSSGSHMEKETEKPVKSSFGAARKKAPQGGVSRKGSQSSPARIGKKSDSKKRHHSSSRSSSSSSSSSKDSSVVSVDFFGFEIALEIFFCVVMNYKVFFWI
jgi:hypothetical protein